MHTWARPQAQHHPLGVPRKLVRSWHSSFESSSFSFKSISFSFKSISFSFEIISYSFKSISFSFKSISSSFKIIMSGSWVHVAEAVGNRGWHPSMTSEAEQNDRIQGNRAKKEVRARR